MFFLSFALWIGIILANLAILGTSPFANELFIMIDNGNASAYFKSLTNLEDMPSWPLLAFDLKRLIIAMISPGVVGINKKEF